MNKLIITEEQYNLIKEYLDEAKSGVYYNSHGTSTSFHDFIDVDVKERNNYSLGEVNSWKKKYNIKDDDKVIWVTPNKRMAQSYMTSSEYHDDILNAKTDEDVMEIFKRDFPEDNISLDDIEPFKFTNNDGFIIPESDDGDDGFLMVLKKTFNETDTSLDEAGSRKQRSILNYSNKQNQANTPKPPAEEEPAQLDTSNTTAEPKPAEEPAAPVDTQSQANKNAGAPVNTNNDDTALRQAAGAMNSIEQILKKWGLNPQTSKKVTVIFLNDIQDVIYDTNRRKFIKSFDGEGNPNYLIRRGYRHIGVFDTSTMMGICSAIGGDKMKSLTFNYKGELSGGTKNTIIATKIKYTNQKESTVLTREVSREEQIQKIENFKQQYKEQYIQEFLGHIESTINPEREFSQDDLETYMTEKVQNINLAINNRAQEQNPKAPKSYDKNLAAITFGLSRPLLTIKLQVEGVSADNSKPGNKAAAPAPRIKK